MNRLPTPGFVCKGGVVLLAAFVLSLSASLPAASGDAAKPGVVKPTETGAITVTTNPDGATVYLDGRVVGQTPVEVRSLSAGPHRLRVVKNGYLDNSRVVTVAPGQSGRVQVRLTNDTTAKAAATQVGRQQPQPQSGKSILKNKWLWIGAAGAGGATAYVLATRNAAPTASGITVTPAGTGMAGVTNYSFNAQASDPDGDSLTYSWNFGDAGTGSGASPSHVFAAPGTYTVGVSVSDGKKSATAPNATVTVGQNLTANWTGGRETYFGCSLNFNMTQNGTNVTGVMTFAGGCSGSVTGVTGTINQTVHPATVTWTTPQYSFSVGGQLFTTITMSFTGTTAGNGATINGTLTQRQLSSGFNETYPAVYVR